MSRNESLCRDLVDVLDVSANVTATGKESKRLRLDTQHALTALRQGGDVDRDKLLRLVDTLNADAQQGRAYMDWVRFVLEGLERDWCDKTPKGATTRTTLPSPRRLLFTPKKELTPRPPSPGGSASRRRRSKVHVARRHRYHSLKKTLLDSAKKKRQSPR